MPDPRSLAQYRGLATVTLLTAALLVSLLSLVGTPPTAVYVGTLATFIAGWDGGLPRLVLVAVLNSVASLLYYLRWIVPTVHRQPDGGATGRLTPRPWVTRTVIAGGAAVLLVGLAAGAVFVPASIG